ncbi:MAG: hypothetical protein J5819_00555 [Eubacterium sp.]|nr:hypothetical protein [Eubacterium sp.]
MKQMMQTPEQLFREKIHMIPAVKSISLKKGAENRINGTIEMQGKHAIQLIVLDQGYPKRIENAIVSHPEKDTSCYRVIVAPYISPSSAELCKKLGVGYLDYSGNCMVSFDTIYLSDIGHPNLFPKEDNVKSIFRASSAVTSKILRELLADISVRWRIQNLSIKVGCSIGMVSRVKEYLCDQLWGEMGRDGFMITDAESILREWSAVVLSEDIQMVSAYSLDNVSQIEKKCSEVLVENNYKGGLAGFSGGARYAPVVRYTKVHMWIAAKNAYDFMEKAGLKEVDSGANVILFIANNDDVFVDIREKDGMPVVSPVQVYFDLMRMQGRGEEMAEAILKKEILK